MDTPHLPLRTNNTLIQGFKSDNANELVSATRDNNILTVAGSVSNNVTALAIKGQTAALDHEVTGRMRWRQAPNCLQAVHLPSEAI